MYSQLPIFKYLHSEKLITELPPEWEYARCNTGPLLFLEQQGVINQNNALNHISKSYNFPVVDLKNPRLRDKIDLAHIEDTLDITSFLRHRALPLLIGTRSFVVAFADPFDQDVRALARFSLDLELKIVIAREQQIYELVREYRTTGTLQPKKQSSLRDSIERSRVLIIDDDPDILMMMEHTLSDKEYQVEGAYNGQDGLDKMHLDPPDVVLVDLKMPVLNGEGFLEKVKESKQLKDIPVVVYTALDTEEFEVNLLDMGAYDFISKKSSHRVVTSRIKSALGQ